MPLLPFFYNLKVSAKLGFGFFIAIIAMIAMAVITASCLNTIQDNASRRTITVDMVGTFDKARLNRTLYQYTNEQQYADKNAQALQELRKQFSQVSAFKWLPEGKEALRGVKAAMEIYVKQRNLLFADMKEMMDRSEALQILPFYIIAKQLDKIALRPDMTTDEALKLQRLSSELKEVAMLTASFSRLPDSSSAELIQALEIAAADAVPVATDTSDTVTLKSHAMAALQQGQQSVSAYITIWHQHNTAAKTLVQDGQNFDAAIAALFDYQKNISSRFVNQSKWTIGIVSITGMILSILIAWQITRSITRPLSATLGLALKISSGDLSQEIVSQRKDEPGLLLQAVNEMSRSLKDIILNVRNGVEHVNHASSEIAAGNEELSSRTEEQAAAVSQTASSMEELSSTVKLNSENALHASRLASDATQIATKGGNVVEGVVQTMEEIRVSSLRISEITSVINGIAFQTNILALNAAVEAARAGESGRGFAVVAGEVRNLAQRSASAAKEIEGLIKESVRQVNAGSAQVDNAGNTMSDIIRAVAQVSEIMHEIAAASDEQNRGIAQINQAMAEMDTTTQQNASLVEESAAAADSLREEAGRLDSVISVFTTGEAPAALKVAPKAIHRPALSAGLPAQTDADARWASF